MYFVVLFVRFGIRVRLIILISRLLDDGLCTHGIAGSLPSKTGLFATHCELIQSFGLELRVLWACMEKIPRP